MAPRRRVPSSRLRYEKHNSIVSIRISTEMYDRLKALRERSDKSLGDILREALVCRSLPRQQPGRTSKTGH